MGEQNVYPGPVDNSGLLKGKKDKAPQKIKPSFYLYSHSKQNSIYVLLLRAKGNKSKHCFLVPQSSLFGSFAEPSSIPLFFCPLR